MFPLQPVLQNNTVRIQPLQPADFETLYAIANDPLLWEQHPNKNRYKRDVFEVFFEGAIASGGAFMVIDNVLNKPIGSSRFYDMDMDNNSITIGYTFIARDHWGGPYNKALKTLMIDYAFTQFNTVHFHIGAQNIRSQKSIERLGAIKIKELEVAYYGEPVRLNFVYEINKADWIQQ